MFFFQFDGETVQITWMPTDFTHYGDQDLSVHNLNLT